MIWSETYIQAAANGILGFAFLFVALENLQLLMTLKRRGKPTRLGRAMTHKYAAWVVAGVVLALLQAYSFYFNLTGQTGWFTFEVRNSLRILGTIAMIVVIVAMRQMRRELQRAEREANGGTV